MRRYADRDDKSNALELIPGWLSWAERQDTAGAYIATWIAFNAIYVAEYNQQYARFKKTEDGAKKFVNRYEYGYHMIDVDPVSERDLVQQALKKLPLEFKRELITLPSPRGDAGDTCLGFFARRVPVWQGIRIEQDIRGQMVRGVINVRETISKGYPRWVPVDRMMLDDFLAQFKAGVVAEVPKRLIEQVGDILYTVRNNLFHGCKGPEDSNDNQVLENALPMLQAIVNFYLDWTGYPMPD
jgi:hypothetical protein